MNAVGSCAVIAPIEFVTLTQPDALPGILARLHASQADRLLFVVPPKLTLTSVDLRILRREAASRGVGLALLTSNVRLRREAARVGISTFRSRWWAARAPWRKLRPEPRNRRRPAGGAEAVAPYAAGLYSPRSPTRFRPVPFLRSFVRRHSPWWGTLGLTLVLLAILAGLLGALMILIPAATITVTPAAEPVQVTVALRAIQDAQADAEAAIVPAHALSAQVTGEARIPTTGRRFEPSTKAKGQVVFVNRTSRPVTVPAGTVVATATGNNVRFATTQELPLASNGRATVPIEALLPGPGSNVRAGTITQVESPLALSLLVANDVPTTGGNVARVGVVTEEDKAQLQALLFDELKQKAFEKLNERLEAGSFIPPESVSYLALSPAFTPFVGDVSPDLYLNMSVQAVGLVVDTQTGKRMALERLQGIMPPGTRLISDTVRYIPGAVMVENPQTVNFSITAEGTLLRGVDTDSVRMAVLGLTSERATAVLAERFALAEPPSVSLGPDWLPYVVPINLPVLPWRIRVNVDWNTAAKLAAR
jgi:hypothetical protein